MMLGDMVGGIWALPLVGCLRMFDPTDAGQEHYIILKYQVMFKLM